MVIRVGGEWVGAHLLLEPTTHQHLTTEAEATQNTDHYLTVSHTLQVHQALNTPAWQGYAAREDTDRLPSNISVVVTGADVTSTCLCKPISDIRINRHPHQLLWQARKPRQLRLIHLQYLTHVTNVLA